MTTKYERARRNQREFRYANRRFFDVLNDSVSLDRQLQLIPFLCECADPDCMGRIEITAWRYEDTMRTSVIT